MAFFFEDSVYRLESINIGFVFFSELTKWHFIPCWQENKEFLFQAFSRPVKEANENSSHWVAVCYLEIMKSEITNDSLKLLIRVHKGQWIKKNQFQAYWTFPLYYYFPHENSLIWISFSLLIKNLIGESHWWNQLLPDAFCNLKSKNFPLKNVKLWLSKIQHL